MVDDLKEFISLVSSAIRRIEVAEFQQDVRNNKETELYWRNQRAESINYLTLHLKSLAEHLLFYTDVLDLHATRGRLLEWISTWKEEDFKKVGHWHTIEDT